MVKLLTVLSLLIASASFAEDETGNNLYSRVAALPGVYAKVIEPLPGFAESLELAVVQPIDHSNPTGSKFTQRVFISHIDYEKPVVIQTHGYAIPWPRTTELASLIEANHIVVEHRFFGASTVIPAEPRNWKYLTVRQAASDHHRLIQLLKTIYTGKWISTGKSKGGQCAYFHRSFFPEDVDATVAYVAPMMFSREDPRILEWVRSKLGTDTVEQCENLQVTLMKNREHVLSRLSSAVDPGDLFINVDLFFELTVLNLPFDLFLRGEDFPSSLPIDSNLEKKIDFYLEVMDLSPYLKRNRNVQSTLHYQTATELGFFSYPRDHLKQYLTYRDDLDCAAFADQDSVPDFNVQTMTTVLNNLKDSNPRMIMIYGAQDMWSSCRIDTSGLINTVTIVHDGSGHDVSISDLTHSERESVYSNLREWIGIHIEN